MRLLAFTILFIAILGLMALTNPSMEDYENFIRQSVVLESRKEMGNPMGQALAPFVGELAGSLVKKQTMRTDYVLLSLYEARVGQHKLRTLGMFRNFFIIEKPDLKWPSSGKPGLPG